MSVPRLTKLAKACAPQRGLALLEVLLGLGVASVAAAAVWFAFGPTSVAADVKQTQMDLSETANAIDRSLGLVGGFSGLSTSLVKADGLAAQRLRQNGGLANVWGGSVSFVANTVKRGNDSFLVETRDVPKAACASLIAAMAGDQAVYDAQVNGESVYVGGRYDPATAAAACEASGGDRLGFVYFSGLASGSSVAVSPIDLPPAPPPVDLNTPSTPATPVAGSPNVDDATPGTPVAVTPGAPVTPPPAAPAVPPAPAKPTAPQPTPGVTPPPAPPSLKACAVPSPATRTESERRAVACPTGQLGSRTQTRSRAGAYACPEAWAAPVLTWGEWTAWATTASTCAPACVAPATTSKAIARVATPEVKDLGCPAPQEGQHKQQRTRVQNGTRTTSWRCPAATGSPVSSTVDTWGGFTATSGWTDTVNTCATPAPSVGKYVQKCLTDTRADNPLNYDNNSAGACFSAANPDAALWKAAPVQGWMSQRNASCTVGQRLVEYGNMGSNGYGGIYAGFVCE